MIFFFFFQAEDGIRDDLVTGVQTCALPISATAKAFFCCTPPRNERARMSSPTGVLPEISGARIAVCTLRRCKTSRRLGFRRARSPAFGIRIGRGLEKLCPSRGVGKAGIFPLTAGTLPLLVYHSLTSM